ncbi:NUDIX domain-containing protein [Micromonospora sp. BRA006-A]|nr:NUDIX domain-containing protein [Micromonospora sp. BRA006-A]
MWLPSGGHVEPGEHPADTVRRELREELGVAAVSRRRSASARRSSPSPRRSARPSTGTPT